MTEQLTKTVKVRRLTRDDLPKRGEWYHVTYKRGEQEWNFKGDEAEEATLLMCVEHVGSNYVRFARAAISDYMDRTTQTFTVCVMQRDLMHRVQGPVDNWREIIAAEIAETQNQLQEAVKALASSNGMGELMPNGAPSGNLLPSTKLRDPNEHREALIKLRDETIPQAAKDVQTITKRLVALQRDTCLPMLIECDRMIEVKETINDRLFVLQLYAGIGEGFKRIRKGKPAAESERITIRQMIRYMDEECLIDYDKGGLDFSSMEKFDQWLAAPVNFERLLPEPRCVVAFRVRRNVKSRALPRDIIELFTRMDDEKTDMFTYLVVRNGSALYRLWTEIDFHEGLLPRREQFARPFEIKDEQGTYDRKTGERKYKTPEAVTPDMLCYDSHVEKRKKEIFRFNRIIFLIQGLLDRTELFHPHPPINLGDEAQIEEHVSLIFDEETGLPSANPPEWERYRDNCNLRLKTGYTVYASWTERRYRTSARSYEREYEARMDGVYEVTRISKDRKKVRVSWPWGTRTGWEHPGPWGSGWGGYGEWPVNKTRHKWLEMKQVFNFEAYTPGEFKKFLCDAYLKGRYIEWAPQLLSAEKWHNERKKE